MIDKCTNCIKKIIKLN